MTMLPTPSRQIYHILSVWSIRNLVTKIDKFNKAMHIVDVMKEFEHKLKFGTVNDNGMVFVRYRKNGKEYWVTMDHFQKMRSIDRVRKDKDAYLKRTYKISIEDYEKKLMEQNKSCAICKNLCSSGRKLAVDHNHKSGNVRGLLCNHCNRGLGYLKESPEIISNVLKYLKNWDF